jgi:molecular chaperone IbpA
MVMRNFDFSPLYRSTVGFDRLFNLLDASSRVEQLNNWPPYNIERLGEDQYRITMAVGAFRRRN